MEIFKIFLAIFLFERRKLLYVVILQTFDLFSSLFIRSFSYLYAVVIVRDKDWYSIAYKGIGRLISDIFVFTYCVKFLSFVEEIFIRIFAALVFSKKDI